MMKKALMKKALMKKNLMKKVLIGFVMTAVLWSAGVSFAASASPVKLVFSNAGAAGSVVAVVSEMFGTEVEKESGGSLDVEVFNSSTLIGHPEMFEALQSGRVDFGDFQISYFTPFMQELTVLEIPSAYRGGRMDALREIMREPIDEIFAKYGIKFIASFPQDTLTFIGHQLVDTPSENLKGKSVRVSGAWNGEAVTAWGGAPVNIAINDVPTALERRTVDMVLSTWIAADGFKMYEVAPYITMTEMQETYCGIAMNLDKWNSLTPEQQAAIERAANTYETKGFETVTLVRKQAFLDKMKELNVNLYVSSEENNKYYSDVAWKLINEQILPTADELTKKLITAISDPRLQ